MLRFITALLPGIIHPDEYFQTCELVAYDLWDLGYKVWEYKEGVRSIIAPYFMFGIPYLLASKLPPLIYLIDKWIPTLMSYSIDYMIPTANLWLWQSSYILLSYHTRPFLNPVESILLCMYAKYPNPVLASLGIWIRPTFGAFILPTLRPKMVLQMGLVSTLWIALDSFYYGKFIITPLNFFLYNSKTTNLSQHGLHPRWLHLVNLFLLLGPLTFEFIKTIYNKRHTPQAKMIISGFFFLSLVPHQEPRFLLPIFPLFLSIYDQKFTYKYSWFIFNAIMVFYYGFHQGGIIPSILFHGRTEFPPGTFSPPTHLTYSGGKYLHFDTDKKRMWI